MRCRNPFQRGMHLFGCGQCMPCRINRRRIWTHRIVLESLLKKDNSFVTLTYSDQNLPKTSDGLPTLDPRHLQNWLKRFRKTIEPLKVRFYGVGEYGDSSQRPHYHLALFGWPVCREGITRYSFRRDDDGPPKCCVQCRTLHVSWGNGRILCGTLEVSSAQYIAGYVTKKMTAPDDVRLNGRYPEFARMSNRPGIGADALHDVASTFLQFNLEVSQGDVPSALRHGSRLLPLGRYLQRKLRLMVGRDEKVPEGVLAESQKEMRALWDSVFDASPSIREAKFKQAALEMDAQKVASLESRQKIFKKREKL